MDLFAFIVLVSGLFLGGLIKGATGAGLPIVAIPVIASVFDIRFAVLLLAVPNFFTNAWQILQYRKSAPSNTLCIKFAIAGAIGAAAGTILLAYFPLPALSIMAVLVVISYVLLRLLKPDYQLPLETALTWVYPVGFFAGSLQGAIGLSSPVSITFLHALRLGRESFVFSVSVFFALLSVLQVPAQILLGLITVKYAALTILALFPIIVGLAIGDSIGKKLNPKTFDSIIMGLLILVCLKMIFDIATQHLS